MHGMRRERPVTRTEAGRNPAAIGAPDCERRPWLLMVVLSVAQVHGHPGCHRGERGAAVHRQVAQLPRGRLQWVVTAYVLASGGLVLLGGRAADVVGRRGTFLAGPGVVHDRVAGQRHRAAAGAADRRQGWSGLGAALLTPRRCPSSRPATRVRSERPHLASGRDRRGRRRRRRAGRRILTTWLGWRSVFLVNVPVGVVAGLLSLRLVPRHRPPRRVVRELDLPGAALAVAGLVTVV